MDREAGLLKKRRAWRSPGLQLALCPLVGAWAGEALFPGLRSAPGEQVGVKV